MTKIFNKTSKKEQRRKLRQIMPEPERRLWTHLRGKQIKGYKFRRQYSVGEFIVDFYCPEVKLALEIDGDSHCGIEAEKYDQRRQCYIESKGVSLLRFMNTDVMENIDGVVAAIAEILPER